MSGRSQYPFLLRAFRTASLFAGMLHGGALYQRAKHIMQQCRVVQSRYSWYLETFACFPKSACHAPSAKCAGQSVSSTCPHSKDQPYTHHFALCFYTHACCRSCLLQGQKAQSQNRRHTQGLYIYIRHMSPPQLPCQHLHHTRPVPFCSPSCRRLSLCAAPSPHQH